MDEIFTLDMKVSDMIIKVNDNYRHGLLSEEEARKAKSQILAYYRLEFDVLMIEA